MPLAARRIRRAAVIGPAPVARTATTVATAVVVAHGVNRCTDRRDDRRPSPPVIRRVKLPRGRAGCNPLLVLWRMGTGRPKRTTPANLASNRVARVAGGQALEAVRAFADAIGAPEKRESGV